MDIASIRSETDGALTLILPHHPFDMSMELVKGFVVTGKLYNSERNFKAMKYGGSLTGFVHAMSINLWRGSVWAEDVDGKRYLLKRTWN